MVYAYQCLDFFNLVSLANLSPVTSQVRFFLFFHIHYSYMAIRWPWQARATWSPGFNAAIYNHPGAS